ncbi:MAG: hypothetical protein AzoDbin1_03941 [Azoarcus sp.]|uniref:Integrating conjugative element protein n=1 Tax=Aromatoleum toluolicum TaxID=90060 RepID=A0ABX1NGU9_9RHOO|nr:MULTISPECIES: hypothetical protein [Rhodocyclales]AKU12461.1 hypothetical protein AzCIB_2568 [Azoarcus sp. CIB]MCK9987469.1 hypothetical protein [Azoarcus sp.]NMF98512.1 hypothetical protein [Aromatoleum toluolicum]
MRKTVLFLLVAALHPAAAVETGHTQLRAVQPGTTAAYPSAPDATEVAAVDRVEAGYWGITLEELHRARRLMRGPRGAFSVATISPVEVLGIHARSDAERDRYAELFAKLLHDDTQRVLAWQRAGDAATRRLYPHGKAIDFGRAPNAPTLPNWYFTPGGAAQ